MSLPILDYVPRLVEANRDYRLTAAPDDLFARSRFWVPPSFRTDQGSEGACVGHAVTNDAMASPVRVKFPRVRLPQSILTHPVPGHVLERLKSPDPNVVAQAVYEFCRYIDEWEGVDYDGTSVRAGMLVLRAMGLIDEFYWAFNMAEFRQGLDDGPAVIGIEWRADMYEAPGGIVRPTGRPVGGHAILVTGYTARHPKLGRAYRWHNSWGWDYGHGGSAYIAAGALEELLFQFGGEAAFPRKRLS